MFLGKRGKIMFNGEMICCDFWPSMVSDCVAVFFFDPIDQQQ